MNYNRGKSIYSIVEEKFSIGLRRINFDQLIIGIKLSNFE
jgi:hypothetical protein